MQKSDYMEDPARIAPIVGWFSMGTGDSANASNISRSTYSWPRAKASRRAGEVGAERVGADRQGD